MPKTVRMRIYDDVKLITLKGTFLVRESAPIPLN